MKGTEMIGNLKALGLALVAMLALGAVAATAASATETQGELTSDGPVTLDIEENIGGENALTAFGSKVEADGTTYTGHKFISQHTTETEPSHEHEFLDPKGETTITVTPHYPTRTCVHNFLGVDRPCTITVNDCDFVFHIGKTTETANTYGVTADVECPKDAVIDLHVYKLGTKNTHEEHTKAENLFCTITVPEQTGLTGPHLTNNTAEGDVDIEGTFGGIKVTKHGGASCGAEQTVENGQFHLDGTVTGTNEAGGDTDIVITDKRE